MIPMIPSQKFKHIGRTSPHLLTSDLVRSARLEVQGVLLKAKDMTATFSFDIQIDPQDESLVILPILRFKHTPTTLLTSSLQVREILLREITGKHGNESGTARS